MDQYEQIPGLLGAIDHANIKASLGLDFEVGKVSPVKLDTSGTKDLVNEKYLKKKIKSNPGVNGAKLANLQKGFQGTQQALKMFKIAGQALDGITEVAGLNTDTINQHTANRAGFGSANKFASLVNKIPGAKSMTAFGATTMQNLNESVYMNQIGSGFSATVQDTNAARDLSGKRILFGASKAKSFLDDTNAQNATITRIGMESELAKQNSLGELYQIQNLNKYQGHFPSLLLGKNGGTIPELDAARSILGVTSKKDISKYQLGGKIIDPSKNIIPDGALHKNRNHLSEHNDELKDQITEKGIPVVSENADGTITQHAEVEVGEVIFNLANTKIIEDYWQQYKETGDDSVAIECGKFLTKELLRNTVDKAGIKKEIE